MNDAGAEDDVSAVAADADVNLEGGHVFNNDADHHHDRRHHPDQDKKVKKLGRQDSIILVSDQKQTSLITGLSSFTLNF